MGHASQSPVHPEAPLKKIKGVTPGHLDTAEGTKCKKLNARPQAGRTEESAVVAADAWFESF
jgi:hypothetical protein